MTLVEHLQELRQRLIVCTAAVLAGAAISFLFRESILELLLRPLPIEANTLIGHDGARRSR
jgi:Sec-independent protein secretion pathway component TatC